ncbi:hypothetical protein D9M69_421860 [compost metagenome]
MQEGGADQDGHDEHHAGADQLLAGTQRLEPKVEHQHRGDEEDQAAHFTADAILAEEVGHDVAAAGHVGHQSSETVGCHGQEDQPAAERPQVAARQPAQLLVAAGAQAGFGHVEHGDDAEHAGDGQARQQRQVASVARGVGHAEHTSANVGADDDTDGLQRAQGMCPEPRILFEVLFDTQLLFPHWQGLVRETAASRWLNRGSGRSCGRSGGLPKCPGCWRRSRWHRPRGIRWFRHHQA